MAGQQWFGQLEGRIQRAIEELAVTKKVIWYIPDILQIALSGTHQGQAASILDQILPAITAGRLVVWTEATPASTARLLRLRPALRSAFEVARLEPLSQEETRELGLALLPAWSKAAALPIDAGCVDTALELRAPIPERRQPAGTRAGPHQADGRPRRQGRQRARRCARRDPDAVAADRTAVIDPRQHRARRSRRHPRLLLGARHGSERGGGSGGGAHRHAQGGAQRSRQAHRRVPVRRADGHGQDGAGQDGGGVPVRLGRPPDPARHERAADAEVDCQDPRQP